MVRCFGCLDRIEPRRDAVPQPVQFPYAEVELYFHPECVDEAENG